MNAPHPSAGADGAHEGKASASEAVQDLLAGRIDEYQTIWQGAAEKMFSGTYRSEDFIEDWFDWWGRAARDVMAASTLAMRSAADQAENGNERPEPRTEAPTNEDVGSCRPID